MKKNFTLLLLIISVTSALLTSCTKMPGHSLIPVTTATTSTNNGGSGTGSGTSGGGGSTGTDTLGVGTIPIGATNSIVFKFKGNTYTWGSPSFFAGINSLSVFQTTKYSTEISFFDTSNSNYLTLGFDNNTVGTYKVTSFILTMTGGINLQQSGSTSSFFTKVTSESIHVKSTQTNEAAGTVKGTFDGWVSDYYGAVKDSVRVSGSYNLSK